MIAAADGEADRAGLDAVADRRVAALAVGARGALVEHEDVELGVDRPVDQAQEVLLGAAALLRRVADDSADPADSNALDLDHVAVEQVNLAAELRDVRDIVVIAGDTTWRSLQTTMASSWSPSRLMAPRSTGSRSTTVPPRGAALR